MNQLDIVIPVKNEAANLPYLVKRLTDTLVTSGISYSLIFIDDRSTDNTIEVLQKLSLTYPVTYKQKKGLPGKAWSILEGVRLSKSAHIVMCDADLQYPPEIIPDMYQRLGTHGVVIANRKVYNGPFFRRHASRLNAIIFGKLLFGLDYDIQSGLKLFRRDIIEHLNLNAVKAWALDIPLLFAAQELGYTIGTVDITFVARSGGNSKINFLETAFQIIHSALRLKWSQQQVYVLKSENVASSVGAGVAYRRNRFVTHSLLPVHQSAVVTLSFWQKLAICFLIGFTIGGILINPLSTAIAIVAVLSTIYFLDVLFNIWVTLKSLHFPPELNVTPFEIEKLSSKILPIYTILCPLYREAHILPHFIRAIENLNWPKHRLDVQLLLEEDDRQTIAAARRLALPEYMKIVIVPHSLPKTKPKALNYGLAHAKGKFIVVYDAEDQPDPLQLKKAYVTFQKVAPQVICLQAKLNYYNPHHNLLTKLFTAEYSLWFDVILPGLQSIGTIIPLGGTSNHFRTDDLKKLHGWDAFNVTEDADLGARLFKEGFKTAIINSTTYEEANASFPNWVRQRSRWLKGYLQTYFVHMRDPLTFIRRHSLHAFIFQLVVGLRVSFMLINPLLWLATFSYFALYAYVGPAIEQLYPTGVFYMAVISLVFGNFLYLYNYMVGAAKHGSWPIVKYIFFMPFYWLAVSYAAVIAVIQLIFKPHFWEKTYHGFSLTDDAARKPVRPALIQTEVRRPTRRLGGLIGTRVAGGAILIIANMVGNFFNFLYNAFLGRSLTVADFGTIGLFGSFLYLSQIPLGALGQTVSFKSSILLGKYGEPLREFWSWVRGRSTYLALAIGGLWLLSTPFLTRFFYVESYLPLLLFTPVWVIGTLLAVDTGYLLGTGNFIPLAVLVVTEAIVKFSLSTLLVHIRLDGYVYAATPLSMTVALAIAWWSVRRIPSPKHLATKLRSFPRRYFGTSILTRLSTAAFISFDLILAKHFLPPNAAGEYALLSLVGKMIFFVGVLFGQFITPVIGKAEGAGQNSRPLFYKLLLIQTVAASLGFTLLGVLGGITVPVLLGERAYSIVPVLPIFSLAIAYYTISTSFVSYHQIRREYIFPLVSFFITLLQLGGIYLFHSDVTSITYVMLTTGVLHLAAMFCLHVLYAPLRGLLRSSANLGGLFTKMPEPRRLVPNQLRILIFNWRDTKHMWAGGAEVYIHELARRWVKDGHKVTLFCGNDGTRPRNEVVEGMQVIRRGGFYTVYLWAFLYYVLKLRGLFDVVIDCENGVPFFTPLYVRRPKFLLIHHIHQNVFREHLRFPLSIVAQFIESRVMPLVYRTQKIITVSASSKQDIVNLGWHSEDIDIVRPGVDNQLFQKQSKVRFPLILYLGRLKPYKNIDLAIKAIAEVKTKYPRTRLVIAGEGESERSLKLLATKLQLHQAIDFVGKVSEKKKRELLAQAWIVVQPSSFEGWGLTVIEANASGTPVVAAKVAGLKDAVVDGETGVLVPVKNVKAMTSALGMLIENTSLRKKLARDAFEWSKQFNWENSAQEFQSIVFRELIRHRLPLVGRVAVAKRM